MGARRRGAHRHSRRAQDKPDCQSDNTRDNRPADVEKAAPAVAPSEVPNAMPRGSARGSAGLKPSLDEVLQSIESLYVDQLKPFGRILRKRIAERFVSQGHVTAGSYGIAPTAAQTTRGDGSEYLPDVDMKHLQAVCGDCRTLHVEPEEGGDWSAVFRDCEPTFVNVHSPDDTYPEELWSEAAAYFEGLVGDDMVLPGGRYSCAQALVARDLSFLHGCSLGQLCHVVQLAISKRKLLGYSHGAVVPYSRSQSMVKEKCAVYQQPCANSTEPGSSGMALATWDVARQCLQEILDGAAEPGQGAATIPLSNVKRLFRSRYQTELSETALGHSKLSELIQDERFADICTVQLQGHGYSVVQTIKPSTAAISIEESILPLGSRQGLENETSSLLFNNREKCRLDLSRKAPPALDESMPFLDPDPSVLLSTPLAQGDVTNGPGGGKWPTFSLSPSSLSKVSMVQNTFIHAAPPPPTPPPGAKQRSHSLPKDVGSDKSSWEAACHSMRFIPRPAGDAVDFADGSTADSCGGGDSSGISGHAPLSPAPSSVQGVSTGDSTSSLGVHGAPMKVHLRGQRESPLFKFLEPLDDLVDDRCSDTCAPQRIQFCPDEPLSLEEAGVFVDQSPPGPPGLPAPPRWPRSPSALAVSSMVQNTFIHAPLTPVTPAPNVVRRSRSLPKDVGFGKEDWLATPQSRGGRLCSSLFHGTVLKQPCINTPSLALSPSPAFVPPSPALTASPLPMWRSGGSCFSIPVTSPAQKVLRLADWL